MKVNPDLTIEVVVEAVERRMTSLDNPGFCIDCGAEHDACEPDAQHYKCEECGQRKVFGAEELLLMLQP